MPSKITMERFTAIVDSREQMVYDLSPMKTRTGTLPTSDYTFSGLADVLAVERKSLADLIHCCGHGRERFERELARLRGYLHRAVICECSWADLRAGDWRSKVSSEVVCHTVLSWQSRFAVPFVLVSSREEAQEACRFFLYTTARRWLARLKQFEKEGKE